MDITHTSETLKVSESALKGLTFEKVDLSAADYFCNVNLAAATMREFYRSGLSLHHCDPRDAKISACSADGMTIDGIAASALFAVFAAGRAP